MNEQLEGLKKQVTENWRIILVAAIVLVISLNSFQNEKQANQSNQPTQSPSASTQTKQDNIDNPENTASSNTTASAAEETSESTKASNNADQTGVAQTAQKGDSMTTMARRAVKGFLEKNGKTLSSEQKIYAEDYVRKLTPTQKIKSGQTLTFSEETIKTAVEKSEKLTEKQIKNLGKFVPLVKNL